MSKAKELVEFLELIESGADELIPLLEKCTEDIKRMGPSIYTILESAFVGIAKLQATQFKELVENQGFTREEALEIVTCYTNHVSRKK